ncbi:MAG: helix-turn-helix transcriptional regulator [Rhodospirillales bacterium]|jgi:transcriptional regulator with XRE-family HTH domain|nr:helix-turn-helix transcriptional regulator [Rhodospirillales bacterium]
MDLQAIISADGGQDTAKPSGIMPSSADLGARIKSLRSMKGWTLDELSTRADIARSTISKIENAQMSPTFDVLQKLSKGFGIDLTQLVSNIDNSQPLGRRSVTLKGEGRRVEGDNFVHEMLCSEIANKKLLPFVSRVTARDVGDYETWHSHDGEDFMYVLENSCTIHTEFYEPVSLSAGDSIFFDSRMGHMVVSNGVEDALVLWVCTN